MMINLLVVLISRLTRKDYRISGYERNLCRLVLRNSPIFRAAGDPVARLS